MAQSADAAQAGKTDRRGFLKGVALLGAGLAALGVLSRRPFGGNKRDGRSIPADVPGAGSIFQPRNDNRSTR